MILTKMESMVNDPEVDFVFSFKYAQAHVYSATKQHKPESFTPTIRGQVGPLWTLRNDDVYCLHWDVPEFVSKFVNGFATDVTQGYYYEHEAISAHVNLHSLIMKLAVNLRFKNIGCNGCYGDDRDMIPTAPTNVSLPCSTLATSKWAGKY